VYVQLIRRKVRCVFFLKIDLLLPDHFYGFNIVHFPFNKITCIIFNTNLLHNVFINYYSEMFRLHFLSILREHINVLMCAASISTYLAEVLHK
jgi:hypothetical protein